MTRRVAISGEGHEPVSGLLIEPRDSWAMLILAHGAGAPMTHPFMESMAEALADSGVATLRYNFTYMDQGRRRPDHVKRLLPVVASAMHEGVQIAGSNPVFAGGKSMGGRMTSTYVSKGKYPNNLSGLVFFGFPLHPAGKPGISRAEHLASVDIPTLFLQGTRDALAEVPLLEPTVHRLGDQATLHMVEAADHSFKVLKRSGRTNDEVMDELSNTATQWMRRIGAQERAE